MSGKAHTDQPTVGLGSSGALSHAYIQHPPLRCSIPETQGLFYDDGNKILLSPTSDQVLSWKIGPSIQPDPPNSDSISEGPVLSIRYSLDRKIIGIQRSNSEIQLKNRETGETFSHRCRLEVESILGFFWTDCPTCDIVLIKTSGLDMLAYEAESNTLRLVEAKRLNVSWFVYTHESRMVLLASGMQCKIFTGFQFSSGGIVRLPKFEMTISKAEANQKPVLAEEDVHIVTIYGRIYSCQVDRFSMLLHLYRFYCDAVVHQGSLPIYSTRIAVSVVDNVLLVHQVDAKVVILYDIFLDSVAPISAPLPLLLRSTSRATTSSSQGNIRQIVPIEANAISAYEGSIYGDGWTFLVPDLICDADHGLLWRFHLDLEAIAASSSEVPYVLEFLQRRRSEPIKTKQLCLGMMRSIILERRPISTVFKAINVLVTSYSHSIKMGIITQQESGRVSSDDPASAGGENAKDPHSLRGGTSGVVADGLTNNSDIHGKSDRQKEFTSNEPHQPITRDTDGARDERGSNIESETFDAGHRQSPLQSEELEPGSSPSEYDAFYQKGPQVASVAISPDEVYQFIFALVEEEMAGDPAYLVAVIIELFRSASLEKLEVPPDLYVMTIQLLVRNDRYSELGLFVLNKILEPSKKVALQLLESDHQNFKTRKLGMDMLRQLNLHHDFILVLVQDGYYLEALRYARKNKVTAIQPSLFLEAALAANDSQHLAAVLRFFSDFMPDFKNTVDHNKYSRILNEMT